MSVKPILFNTEMVKAILDGRKTQTRRVVKERGWDITGKAKFETDGFWFNVCKADRDANAKTATCHHINPPYNIGDVLWVRETWRKACASHKQWINGSNFTVEEQFGFQYKADLETRFDNFFEVNDEFNSTEISYSSRWHPSIHMPREAARIFLQVTDIKVERLHDIDCAGALAEGCDGRCDCPSNGAEGVLSCITKDFSIERFQTVWDATIPKHPNKFKRYPYYWNDNPWVWVISFERCEKPKEWDNVQQSK